MGKHFVRSGFKMSDFVKDCGISNMLVIDLEMQQFSADPSM